MPFRHSPLLPQHLSHLNTHPLMSHHLLKNLLQTPPVLCLYNFIRVAVRANSHERLLQAGHPQRELAGEIQEPPSTLMCHAGLDWLQNQGAPSMPWHKPGGLVTQLSTAGVHTQARGRGVTCRSPDSGRDSPLPLILTATGGQACTAPPPAREGVSLPTMPGVTGTSQRDSRDFIPSFFLFHFPVLELAKQPLVHPTSHPALCHGPWGTSWRSLSGHSHSPASHPSQAPIPAGSRLCCWSRAAQIQRTNQPQHKPEQGFQQAIGSVRARSQLLGKAELPSSG